MTTLFLLLGLAMVAAAVLPIVLLRDQERRHVAELDRLEKAYVTERTRLQGRVTQLEYQLAAHTAHVLKLPPPVPPGPEKKPEPLPDIMVSFLEAIEDEEARFEYETDFRQRLELNPNADPAKIVAEAMSASA